MEDQLILERKEGSGLTFKDILFKYLRFLPFFVISLALAILTGYLYLRYTTPTDQTRFKMRQTEQQRVTQQIGFATGIISTIALVLALLNRN